MIRYIRVDSKNEILPRRKKICRWIPWSWEDVLVTDTDCYWWPYTKTVTDTYKVKRILKNKKMEVYTLGKPPYDDLIIVDC